MRTPLAYGIDFGTSNSSISVAYQDEAVLVQLGSGGEDVMPSIIYFDATGQQLAGHAAVRQFLVAGSQPGVRLMSAVKSFLADDTWHGTESPKGPLLKPADIVAVLFRELKSQADAYCGADVRRAVLGHPVFFVGAEGKDWERRNNLAKERLKEAAKLAGFKEVSLVEESTAALAGEEHRPGIIMALDFGGGTFDVSIMATDGARRRRVLASRGVSVGGERFNELLFDGFVGDKLGLTHEYLNKFGKPLAVPESLRKFRSLDGALRMVSDPATHAAVQFVMHLKGGHALKILDEIIYGGHTYAFHKEVESAKIALSTAAAATVEFHRRHVDVHAPVDRASFDVLIAPHLDRVDHAIDEALAEAKVQPADVDLVVRTGGSSQVPAFIDRMSAKFGTRKVEQRDALATVAIGLGLEAIEVWG